MFQHSASMRTGWHVSFPRLSLPTIADKRVWVHPHQPKRETRVQPILQYDQRHVGVSRVIDRRSPDWRLGGCWPPFAGLTPPPSETVRYTEIGVLIMYAGVRFCFDGEAREI